MSKLSVIAQLLHKYVSELSTYIGVQACSKSLACEFPKPLLFRLLRHMMCIVTAVGQCE